LEEDPWCSYKPTGKKKSIKSMGDGPVWSDAAKERMKVIPGFLREVVRRRAELYALESGHHEITPELLKEIKPKFDFKSRKT
jgi:hypothetical protein